MEKKTKFKRRMFAVAAIVGMGMTMTQIAFGKESFNAENGGLNYVLPADNGYYFLCGGHLYFWNGDVTKQAVPLCSRPNCSHTTEDCYMAKRGFKDRGKDDANMESGKGWVR